MSNAAKYIPLIRKLKDMGYLVFIAYMEVPKAVSVERAMSRYKNNKGGKTKYGRYVPMDVIDDFFKTGKAGLEEIKHSVDGYIVVDSLTQKIIEKGGMNIPQDRDYAKMFEQGQETPEPFILMNEQMELESAIEMLTELLPDLKGKEKKECQEAIEMLKELLPTKDKMSRGGKLWIKDAVKHKGALKQTALKQGLIRNIHQKLSVTDLHKLEHQGGKTAKQAHLAETFRSFSKGGVVTERHTAVANFLIATSGLDSGMKGANHKLQKIVGKDIFYQSLNGKLWFYNTKLLFSMPISKINALTEKVKKESVSEFIKIVNAELKKHKADPQYDEFGDNMNKVFEQFEKKYFLIDDDSDASDFILGATPMETLEYLKKRAESHK